MSTLRPTTADENRFRNGTNEEVYEAATEYVRQMNRIFERLPEKVQRANTRYLESDLRSSDALSTLEHMFSNGDNNNQLDEEEISRLVGLIVDEADAVRDNTEELIEDLLEDEQTSELYRTNLMREWTLGDPGSSSDSDGDHDEPRPPPMLASDARRISITSNETSSFRPIKPKPRTSSESRIDEHFMKQPTNAEKPLVSSSSVPEKLSSINAKPAQIATVDKERLKKLTEVKTSHSFVESICDIQVSCKKGSGSSSSSVSGNSLCMGRLEQDSFEKLASKGSTGYMDDRSSSEVSSPASANGMKIANLKPVGILPKAEKPLAGAKDVAFDKTQTKRKVNAIQTGKKTTKKQKRSSADHDRIDKMGAKLGGATALSSVKEGARAVGSRKQTDDCDEREGVPSKATTSKARKTTTKKSGKVAGKDPEDDSGTANGEEEKYCHCQRFSFGSMIACDNDDCEYEWFHFECVALSSKPKGKWYCPDCKPQFIV